MNSVLRLSFAAAALGSSALCLASFDLMLLPGNDGRIHRYDPVNNIQLGSYTSASSNHMIATDGTSRSFSASSGSSAMRVYNYNTGELQGVANASTSNRAFEFYNGGIWATNGVLLRRYNPTTGALTNNANIGAGVTWHTMARIGDNFLFAGVNGSNAIALTSVNATTFAMGSILTTTITVAAGSDLGKAAAVSNSLTGNASFAFTYTADGTTVRFAHNPLSSAFTLNTSSLATSSLAGAGGHGFGEVMPAAVAGHNGLYIVGQDFTTPATVMRVTRYDMYTAPILNSSASFTAPGGGFSSVVGSAWHPANVVAPEPGTLVACGVGLVALLRRRRR